MRGAERKKIQQKVLAWYQRHGRDLPWRRTHDPYYILVSEIMLQQTQVPRVIEKYQSFIKRFPTVQRLARAKPASVITEWKGLGYNRRALFLQRTAQAVVTTHKGEFPKTIEELTALPGIGDYTARAVLSFAFKKPVPMMDTNHRKFYSRLFPEAKNDAELLIRAEWLLDGLTPKQVYDWNQCLMDLMTAVAKGESDDFLEWLDKKYPAQLIIKKKKKKTVPFKETDRYVRGRIIDSLREADTLSLQRTKKVLNIDDVRFSRVIDGLLEDGLIKKVGRSIMLP